MIHRQVVADLLKQCGHRTAFSERGRALKVVKEGEVRRRG